VYIGVIGFCSFGSLDIWGVSSSELGFDRLVYIGLGDFARRVLLVWSFIQYRYTMCFSISYDLAFITSWRQFICCLVVVAD